MTLDAGAIGEKLEHIEETLVEIKDSLKALNSLMERLTRLEEKHDGHVAAIARSFERIEALENGVRELELQEPVTKMVRTWVISGVIGVTGLIGAQFFFVATHAPQSIQIVLDKATIEGMMRKELQQPHSPGPEDVALPTVRPSSGR
jgi:predicted nuclease with TOPRIM domain